MLAARLPAQPVEIVLFVPGNYLADNLHRVELYNPTGRRIDLGGYLLVTRDYSMEFPPRTVLNAHQRLVIGKAPRRDIRLDLVLTNVEDFLIRLYSKKAEGNYIALFNRQNQLIDAFYHAKLRNIPFLPDEDRLVRQNKSERPFRLPPESDEAWTFFPFGEDPAVGFEKRGGEWRPVPANPNTTVYPDLRFEDVKARYEEGSVSLQWSTARELNVEAFRVERSKNRRDFHELGRVQAHGKGQAYTYVDADVQQDCTYYYRLSNLGLPEDRTYSKVVEVTAAEVPLPFWIEVYPKTTADARSVSIRFFSAFSQDVTIKLVNSRFREVAILHNKPVFAESQHLLQLAKALPPDDYLIVAQTERKRYFRPLNIRDR